MYLRVRAVVGANYLVTFSSGENWKVSESDSNCFEYTKGLNAGETTETLELNIDVVDSSITNDFNVIILQETTKVLYDEAGNPYADWDAAVKSTIEEGSSDVEITEGGEE